MALSDAVFGARDGRGECTLRYIVYLLWMRRNNERTRLEIKAKNITAGNYSILVKNLPYNATVAEIVTFFSPYAPPSQPAASPRDSVGCD
jgi:hypothetical protein